MSAGLFLFIVAGVALAINSVVLWRIVVERRRLEELRYGRSGSAFSERDRDRATSRLRDRSPW